VTVPPPARTSFADASRAVPARSTQLYTAIIEDQAGAPIPAAALTTLTMTLLDYATGQVVNNVNAQNILNTDRGVIDAQGNLTVTLRPLDTAIFGPALPAGQLQYRSIVFDWTYNSGNSTGRHEFDFAIMALAEA
jgi:hypothetical protein